MMSGKRNLAGRPGIEFAPRPIEVTEACPYLPDREATLQGFALGEMESAAYRQLIDHGFRRSGRFFYRPACHDCHECVPLRVPVKEFRPSRSQRRCLYRNKDITVTLGRPAFSEEKFSLYDRYVRGKHDDTRATEPSALCDFLYTPVVDSLEFCYRDPGGRLLAVGICDVFEDALSSVYCFYDPLESKRGLGTFTALNEVQYAQQQGLAYYLVGYYVSGCSAMSYKASFRPYELLDMAGRTGWKKPWPES